MEVNFYVNKSPTIKIDKTLERVGPGAVDCDIWGDIDLINPVIIVAHGQNVPATANYMVCGAPLNRSYFISAIDHTVARTAVIAGHCDVLSTFKDKIKAATFNFVKGAPSINEIEDSSYPLGDALTVERFNFSDWDNNFFSNSDDGQRYLLRVADGRAREWDYTIDLQIGDKILYKNLLFTLQGSWNAAYLSDPQEISLPPETPYPQVADGTIFSITNGSSTDILSQDYKFLAHYHYDISSGPLYYQLIAVND